MMPSFMLGARTAAAMLASAVVCAASVTWAEEAAPAPESKAEEPVSNEVKLSPEQTKLVGIKTSEVKAGPLGIELVLNGEVTANQDKTVQVLSRTAGVVNAIKKSLGDLVRADETMAVISSRELAEAESTFATAKSKADLATVQLTREETLWNKKATSEQEYLAAKAGANETLAELQAAEQKLKLLESTHKATTEHATGAVVGVQVNAPFDGTIIEKRIALGDQVTDQSPLFKIADLKNVWVIANVFEKDIARIKVGQAATVTVRAYPNRNFSGPITWVAAVLDPKTRTLEVRIELDNSEGLLTPGSFATVAVKVVTNESGLSVPTAAVQRQKTGSIVFVKSAEGVFERREVKLGEKSPETVEIVDGLKAGESVVTNGSFILKSELEKSSFAEE